ncbi:ac transposable element-derived 4 [Paramuricea clavata]|uniref:Ac transposable element-derived 4 n=1 Tax=Paramuricea clavata TaxID=317549 RepID=A0A7D9HTZ8_PARCT|nr:ac transposable element-derived 4 [Paramuricea clavata]
MDRVNKHHTKVVLLRYMQTYTQKSAKEGKTTEKPIRKGYKLFFEYYHVFDVVGLNVDNCSIKGKCYRSPKKSQVLHNMTVNLSNNGDIMNAKCNCVAGASGFCCHVMALLYLIDHTLKLGLETFPRVGTCTDNPQQWHKPRTLGIKAEPIMGISVIDPKHEKKRFSGIQSTLFEPRQGPAQNSSEGNIQVFTNIPALSRPLSIINTFPDLPYSEYQTVSYYEPLQAEEDSFIHETLPVTNATMIEGETRGQKDNAKWFDMRKNRVSSSNFGQVCKRKDNISQEKLVSQLVNGKDISHIPAVNWYR